MKNMTIIDILYNGSITAFEVLLVLGLFLVVMYLYIIFPIMVR